MGTALLPPQLPQPEEAEVGVGGAADAFHSPQPDCVLQTAVDVTVLVTGVAETVMVLVVPGRVLTMVLGCHSLQD